jgi:hypothetical protein
MLSTENAVTYKIICKWMTITSNHLPWYSTMQSVPLSSRCDISKVDQHREDMRKAGEVREGNP